MELKANDTIVVAMIAASCSLANRRARSSVKPHIIANLALYRVDQNVKERHCLDHHASVSAREDRPAECEHELRDDAPAPLASDPNMVRTDSRHEEHGNTQRPKVDEIRVRGESIV
jgi:hypothetical protein